MADELDELIDFLSDPKAQVRTMAVGLVEGLSGSQAGIDTVAAKTDKLLRSLFRLVADEPDISRAAITSLVNLSQEPGLVEAMLELKAVSRCMEALQEKASPHADLLVMLLSNITTTECGSQAMLRLGDPDFEGYDMAVLVNRFLAPGEQDTYQYVAAILTNVTRLKAGRQLLLEPGKGFLAALVAQLRSANLIRRRGAAAAIRNICFSTEREGDGTVREVVASQQLLKDILEPLCGISGAKEEDDTVREALAEAMFFLAETSEGRAALWEAGAAQSLAKGYELEEHRGVCQAMERTAELFMQEGLQPGGIMAEEASGTEASIPAIPGTPVKDDGKCSSPVSNTDSATLAAEERVLVGETHQGTVGREAASPAVQSNGHGAGPQHSVPQTSLNV